MSIRDHIDSDNPLSDGAIKDLIYYQEEDKRVDYKETIEQEDWKNEKQWLELTKDFMAFANTEGGYLIFGVEDSNFDIVGICDDLLSKLTETKIILDKINRYVRPEFTDIRSREFEIEDSSIVVVYVPQSLGKTHVVTKEGSFFYPNGSEKEIVLRPGDIYVRRTATNHVVSPEELDEIINRRIEFYREKLFDRISRISKVSPDRLIKAEEESEKGEIFRLSSDPDAPPVQGMSYSTSPSSLEEEIAANIALSRTDPGHEPSEEKLWKIYSKRKSLTLTYEMSVWLFKNYLVRKLPFFYWCKPLEPDDIKDLIREVVDIADTIEAKSNIANASLIYGDRFYRGTIDKFTKNQRNHIGHTKNGFYDHKSDEKFNGYLIDGFKRDFRSAEEEDFESYLESLVIDITDSELSDIGAELRRKAISIDYFLYKKFAIQS